MFPTFTFSQSIKWDSLRNHIDSKSDTAKINALYLSAYNLSSEFPDSAVVLGKRALSLSQKSNYLRGLAESFNNVGTAFRTLSQFDSGKVYYQMAISYFDKIKDEKGKAVALNNLGHLEQDLGNYEEASEYLLQSIAINEHMGNLELLGSNFINLGIVLSNIDRVDEALEYYRKAIPIKEEANDDKSLGNVHNNIAIEFRKRKQYDSALQYNKLAIKYRKQAKAYRDLAASSSNLGILYFYLGKKDSTLILFKEALKTYEKIGEQREIARTYFNISELYRMQEQNGRALTNLELSLDGARKANSKEQIRDALLGLARVNASKNDYASAYKYRLDYELYKDSLLNDRNNKTVLELTEKYESEKKDNQITALELDQQTSKLLLAKSENERNILIAISIAVLLAAVLLFLLFRSKRRSLKEREILLKEIHHRVKNNLQIISSLLNLQAGSLEDEAAASAVKEGQHRVKSMALIHQKLYSEEDIRGVDIQDYFENLLSALFAAFGVSHVDHEVNTNGIKLDVDTVIPIGLIVNELITNSIKYAFVGKEAGVLNIDLTETSGRLELVVRDSGEGMDEVALKTSNSFGWKMIKSLSRKLKAEINIINDEGTAVHLIMYKYKLVV